MLATDPRNLAHNLANRLNLVFPIAGLPDELLAEVFSWYILAVCSAVQRYPHYTTQPVIDLYSPEPAEFIAPPLTPYSWIIIRHVCRAWRMVALTYPALSTRIFMTRPECVRDLLSRAGNLPLYIYLPSYTFQLLYRDDMVASCNLVLPHLGRISHASLLFPEESAYPGLQASQSGVSEARSLDLRFQEAWSVVSPFPSDCAFPELHSLSCHTANITALRNVFVPHLRTLELVNCSSAPVNTLLALLRTMPGLEELVLDKVISGLEHWTQIHDICLSPQAPDRVALPHLRRISISAWSASEGLPILDRIEHPPSTAIDLHFHWLLIRGEHAGCDCVLRLLLAKIDAWRCLEDPAAQSLHVIANREQANFSIMLTLWRERLPLSSLPTSVGDDSAFFRFSLSGYHETFIANVVRRLPLSNVKTALLKDEGFLWDVVKWEDMLASLSSVEELALFYEAIEHEGAQLHEVIPRDTHAFCPRLKVVRIRESQLDHSYGVLRKPSPDRVTLAHLARGFAERNYLRVDGGYETPPFQLEVQGYSPRARRPQSSVQQPSGLKSWLAARGAQISATLKRRRR